MLKMIQHITLTLFLFGVILEVTAQPKLVLPVGHAGRVYSLRYSPNGKYVVTRADDDKAANVWEVSSGKLLHSLGGHIDEVGSTEYSPDGKFIATTAKNTIKLWDATSGNNLYTSEAPESIEWPQFSKNGKLILTGGDKNVHLWEAASGKLLYSLKDAAPSLYAQFTGDEKFIMTTALDANTVKLWDVATGKLIHSLQHVNKIESTQSSPDGKYVVGIAAENNTAKVWETSSGKLVQALVGYKPGANMLAIQFSPDGKFLTTTASSDRTTKIWELSTGKLENMLIGHPYETRQVLYSADGKLILTNGYNDNAAKIWDASSGKLLRSLQGTYDREAVVHVIQFSPHGKYVLTSASDDSTKVWETSSGKLLNAWKQNFTSAQFSPNGEHIAVVDFNDGDPVIREAASGKLVQTFKGYAHSVNASEYSPDGKFILTSADEYNSTKVWEVSSGKLITSLEGRYGRYSRDGKYIITTSNGNANIYEAASGKLIRSLAHPNIWSTEISPDGKYVATSSGDDTVLTWDFKSGNVIDTLQGKSARYSADGKYVVTTAGDYSIIWDAVSGKQLRSLEVGALMISSAARFSPDGKYVVTTEYLAGIVAVCSAATGESLRWIKGRTFQFSPDGKFIATAGNSDNLANIWDIQTGKLRMKLEGHATDINGLQYSPDGKYILTMAEDARIWDVATGKMIRKINTEGNIQAINKSWTTMISEKNSKLSLHNLNTGEEILTWIRVDSIDWVVSSPSGLFDASPGAMSRLYFVQGLDVIDFSQLKERYYEPGLWKKIMTGEKLRNVTGMRSIDLPPDIRVGEVDDKGYLPVELINRGGGIGEVAVYVQGKEVAKDIRSKDANPDAPTMQISYYVGNHKNLLDGENVIGVKAWNKDHWVESRGSVVSYFKGYKEGFQPSAHIISVGISDYAGGADLDLNYAAKDAEDMSKALQLGAAKLFGTQKSYLYNLTTLRPQGEWPTKANIIKTFGKIASTAHPLDVIIVYLSGHGISVGGSEGDWHYLTQDAHTINASAYADPSIREQTTLSSNELVELFKSTPIAKQVLMIDACASGKVVDNLITKKDIPSSTLRALDRMKDRIGLHIITGCTSDAVSYEASKYGQGVLTYSLLEGIRGAALRDEEFVDVNKLFQYAQDRVPALAEGIGGIQKPMVFSPQGSQSFDIGQLSDVEKKEVPISKIRPVYIQSNFQDDEEMSDVIGLGKKVDQLLNETASRGTTSPLIFVPVREYPDGCQLVGRYRKENGTYILKLKKKCEGKDKTVDVKGSNLDELSKKVINMVGVE